MTAQRGKQREFDQFPQSAASAAERAAAVTASGWLRSAERPLSTTRPRRERTWLAGRLQSVPCFSTLRWRGSTSLLKIPVH